jgi:hypothetical protein
MECRYPERYRQPKKWFDDITAYMCNELNVLNWRRAMEEEYNSIIENGTWALVDPPSDKKIVQNKWVLNIKRGTDGSTSRHKARLVAKGYPQEYGIDYEETFSPVIRNVTIKMLFGLAAELTLQVNLQIFS